MKLTVCKVLKERIGSPSIHSKAVNIKNPGDTIEIVKVLWGEVIDGNGIWYLSDQGFFYWSGCFVEVNFVLDGCDINDYSGEERAGILQQLQETVHQQLRAKVDGYLGCGFGHKNYEDQQLFSMLIYVERKLSATNPDLKYPIVKEIKFWGFKILTDVIEMEVAVLMGTNPNLEHNSPYLVGGGISNSNRKVTGTRFIKASKVRDNNPNVSDYFLLTCCHVVFPNPVTNIDYQRNGSNNVIANFPISDEGREYLIEQAEFNNERDFAAIPITPTAVQNIINKEFVNDHFGIGDINDLSKSEVWMVGFESGFQIGKIKSVFDKFPVKLSNGTIHEFKEMITTTKISIEGDSGAPVIAKVGNNYKLIGMVVAGNSSTTCILPFYKLANKYGFSLK